MSFSQDLLRKELTRYFMMISMSVVHSLSISSLRRITNSVYYGWFKTWIYSLVDAISSIHLFHDNFNVCGIFQISFCYNFLGKELNSCFMMISTSVVQLSQFQLQTTQKEIYSLRVTRKLHIEILSGNSSNHLFHGDFDFCGIFCNL